MRVVINVAEAGKRIFIFLYHFQVSHPFQAPILNRYKKVWRYVIALWNRIFLPKLNEYILHNIFRILPVSCHFHSVNREWFKIFSKNKLVPRKLFLEHEFVFTYNDIFFMPHYDIN